MVALGVGYADAFQAFRDELFAEPGLVARRVRRAPFCGLAPQNLRRHLALLLALPHPELLEGVLERGASVQERLVLAIGRHEGGHAGSARGGGGAGSARTVDDGGLPYDTGTAPPGIIPTTLL